MFTGIVQAVGRVREISSRGGDVEFVFDTGPLELADCGIGDSIAVSGACLTAIRLEPHAFAADVSRETLDRTTLGQLAVGSAVNLEKALRAGQALGGHYVTGHVDGVARVIGLHEDARSRRVRFEVPKALARYVATKGSITVDGVSLTVNEVDGCTFGVNLVPHTLEVTTLGGLLIGSSVNIEIDIIARYVERLVTGPSES
jgi:riboflavin synthase